MAPRNIDRLALSISVMRRPSRVGSTLVSASAATLSIATRISCANTRIEASGTFAVPPRAVPAVAASAAGWPLALGLPACARLVRPPEPGASPIVEPAADAPGLGEAGVKYSANPLSRCLSGLLISQSSMKNAIIAVTKSAYATFQAPP